MSTDTVAGAVARRQDSPGALIEKYQRDFATVLPSHVKPETWVRLAQGALRRNPKLEEAARANPGSLLAALLDAARQGLEPGTEQYYLVPYKEKSGWVVQGLPGYQGEIELMYRAGAVSSVVVEVVRKNDKFSFRPGRDERPQHEVDWFGEDRGPIIGVYAYAVMADGATSKVVVLNRKQIEEARSSSASYRMKRESSPWTTHEEAMILKTAAHRLRKWVPTSAEYRRELARAQAEAERIAETQDLPPMPVEVDPDAEVVDGEVVDEQPSASEPVENPAAPAAETLDGSGGDWPEAAKPADAKPSKGGGRS